MKKKVRFLPEPGDGGACAITVEELVEDYLSEARVRCLKDSIARWNQIWM